MVRTDPFTLTPSRRRVLAIFSDDGCRITVKTEGQSDYVFDQFQKGQHLPSMSQSFHVLAVTLETGVTYQVKVDYSNVRYHGTTDIDGCTLFAFDPSLELVNPDCPYEPRRNVYLMNSALLKDIYEGSYSGGIPQSAKFRVRLWGYNLSEADAAVTTDNPIGEPITSHLVKDQASGSLISDKPLAIFFQDSFEDDPRGTLTDSEKNQLQQPPDEGGQGVLLLADSDPDDGVVILAQAPEQDQQQGGQQQQQQPPQGQGNARALEINIEYDNMYHSAAQTLRWQPAYPFTVTDGNKRKEFGDLEAVWNGVKDFFQKRTRISNVRVNFANETSNKVQTIDWQGDAMTNFYGILGNHMKLPAEQAYFSQRGLERWVYVLGCSSGGRTAGADYRGIGGVTFFPPFLKNRPDDKTWKAIWESGRGSFIFVKTHYDWLEGSDGEVNNDIRLAIYFTLLHELSHVLICAGDEAHDWGRTDPGKSAENYCEIMAPLYPIPNRDRGFWLGFTKPYLTRCLLSDAIGFSDKNKRRILDSVTFLKTEGQ